MTCLERLYKCLINIKVILQGYVTSKKKETLLLMILFCAMRQICTSNLTTKEIKQYFKLIMCIKL